MPPGRGTLKVAGTVGPMMRESAKVAMTWVRSHADRISGAARLDDSTDVHVLLAATKLKDGTSAGVALAAALVSALTGQVARVDVAMSGELTLAGAVEPVGGIREKVLGACRARMTTVLLPAGNEADVAENLGDELPGGPTARYATTMDDVSRGGVARRRGVVPRRGRPSTRADAGESRRHSVFPPALSGAAGASRLPAKRRPPGQAAVDIR